MWWNIIALAVVILLIIYLSVEIYLCRKRLVTERFEDPSSVTPTLSIQKPFHPRACDSLLTTLDTQPKQQQMMRQRLMKATPETNPNLNHTDHDYCYVRDFDYQTAIDYSPQCDVNLSKVYNNSMIKRVFKADVKDQDSLVNVPRQVCLMELEKDKININNVTDFVLDLHSIDNAEFAKDLTTCKTEVAVLQKNNAELSTAVSDLHSRLSNTQQVANKEATVAKQVQIELRAQQLQNKSDTSNTVIIMDGEGEIIYETNAPTTFDMTKFKGHVKTIIIPKQNSFRVILTNPRGDFTFNRTEMNTSQAGLEVQRIRVL